MLNFFVGASLSTILFYKGLINETTTEQEWGEGEITSSSFPSML
jgi:hypothetical protein